MNDYHPLLSQIRVLREDYGSALQPPAGNIEIDDLIARTKKDLAYDLPSEYTAFLRFTNGLIWNGFQVYAASIVEIVGKKNRHIGGFVESNLQYHAVDVNRAFIAFGETGDARFVLDKRTGKFAEIDQIALDAINTYPSFNALLCRLLERALT